MFHGGEGQGVKIWRQLTNRLPQCSCVYSKEKWSHKDLYRPWTSQQSCELHEKLTSSYTKRSICLFNRFCNFTSTVSIYQLKRNNNKKIPTYHRNFGHLLCFTNIFEELCKWMSLLQLELYWQNKHCPSENLKHTNTVLKFNRENYTIYLHGQQCRCPNYWTKTLYWRLLHTSLIIQTM